MSAARRMQATRDDQTEQQRENRRVMNRQRMAAVRVQESTKVKFKEALNGPVIMDGSYVV